MSDAIYQFKGEYRFLSNFYRADVHPFWWPTTLPPFPGNEWLFQAHKIPGDIRRHTPHYWLMLVERIRSAPSAAAAKQLGRSLDLDDEWEEIKIDVMRYCVQLKFRTHSDLAAMLLDTGDALLVEGNTWNDTFWGARWNNAQQEWVGKNWLGHILMEEREELRR